MFEYRSRHGWRLAPIEAHRDWEDNGVLGQTRETISSVFAHSAMAMEMERDYKGFIASDKTLIEDVNKYNEAGLNGTGEPFPPDSKDGYCRFTTFAERISNETGVPGDVLKNNLIRQRAEFLINSDNNYFNNSDGTVINETRLMKDLLSAAGEDPAGWIFEKKGVYNSSGSAVKDINSLIESGTDKDSLFISAKYKREGATGPDGHFAGIDMNGTLSNPYPHSTTTWGANKQGKDWILDRMDLYELRKKSQWERWY